MSSFQAEGGSSIIASGSPAEDPPRATSLYKCTIAHPKCQMGNKELPLGKVMGLFDRSDLVKVKGCWAIPCASRASCRSRCCKLVCWGKSGRRPRGSRQVSSLEPIASHIVLPTGAHQVRRGLATDLHGQRTTGLKTDSPPPRHPFYSKISCSVPRLPLSEKTLRAAWRYPDSYHRFCTSAPTGGASARGPTSGRPAGTMPLISSENSAGTAKAPTSVRDSLTART